MLYRDLDTPALLIDRDRLAKNLADMQSYANNNKVKLRPHTFLVLTSQQEWWCQAGNCMAVH